MSRPVSELTPKQLERKRKYDRDYNATKRNRGGVSALVAGGCQVDPFETRVDPWHYLKAESKPLTLECGCPPWRTQTERRVVLDTCSRVLDFDIENRPLTYIGNDYTSSEITAIAASFGPGESVKVWLLGRDDPRDMLDGFREMYDQAHVVTGHYIRKHDLPIINGALIEYGMAPLSPKLTHDTYQDLVPCGGISKSQESLAAMLGVDAPKIGMSQKDWREANRLEHIELAERRVVGDVRQHQEMRARMLERGLLKLPRMWSLL